MKQVNANLLVLLSSSGLTFLCFICAGALRHSLEDRLSKISSKSRDEIYLKLRTSTGEHARLFLSANDIIIVLYAV